VLNRFEVPIEKSAMYRELSHIYYAPNPSYSIWGDALKDKWEIYVAHKKNIATQKDMDVNDYFEQANQQLIDSGVEYNEADDKAGVMTAKKFQLKKDFMLFSGNVNESDDGVSRASINIINEGKDTSLTALNGCLSAANINVKACTKQ